MDQVATETGNADRPTVVFAMGSDTLRETVLPAAVLDRLRQVAELPRVEVITDFAEPAAQAALAEADVMITCWGAPRIDAEVLDRAPRLRLIAHAAGTVKNLIDRDAWRRGIRVTTAAEANGIPVAEYTLAVILLAGKRAWQTSAALGAARSRFSKAQLSPETGNVGAVVGIIGASRVGRRVIDLLRPFEVQVLLADPFVTEAEAELLGVTLVGLDDLMARSDVVSLHAPILPSTIGMIGAAQFALMRDGTTFVNTARGVLVDHDALREHAAAGRIAAVLDVTTPEPLPDDDVLYTLPNVFLTPHIAGSMGNELPMMGEFAVAEVERLVAGEPAAYPVTLADLERMA